MSEVAVQGGQEKPWREWTGVELANSYVDHYQATKRKEISSLESQVTFEENYTPKVGSYRQTEKGGMDEYDDSLLSLEADQYESDREINLGQLESNIREIEDDLEMNELARESIKDNDQDYIVAYAQLETRRREKLEEKSKPK